MSRQLVVRYSAWARVFHWLTAILVLAAFILGPGGSEARVYDASRDFDRQLHETLGLLVLGLTIIRLAWRAIDVRPEPPEVPKWMNITAKTVQFLLYVLLFAVPLTAITGAWLEGHPLTLMNGIRIAPIIAESHATGETIAEIHTWLGDAILWLAGFHAAAALFHHYILRDKVLVSMLPGRSAK